MAKLVNILLDLIFTTFGVRRSRLRHTLNKLVQNVEANQNLTS
ncbi:hypothetical protein [Nostoc sp. NIES-3756]|nr:hypothetical protein [Nostoc sp. NIES-3756]